MPLNPVVAAVTARIKSRSAATRVAYLKRMDQAREAGTARGRLGCTNLAHAFAAAGSDDKPALRAVRWPNLGIVSAYNDMLSAHQPLERYPALIKQAAREAFAVAQFAGGVPAMCDGVTQGEPGMELSLFSRDVIAMSAAIALSHNTFDATLMLGVCDKIVPGLFMGAAAFGHLPIVFVPAGPMASVRLFVRANQKELDWLGQTAEALIGDAAHSIHPLAGQGLNLGLLDAGALADEMLAALRSGLPAGHARALSRYSRERRGDNSLMLHAMTGFERLFASDDLHLRILRNTGMRLFDRSGPLKALVMRSAMGLTQA